MSPFFSSLFFFCLTLTILVVVRASEYDPQQIHLSLGTDPTNMVLVWATTSHSAGTDVIYGTSKSSLNHKQSGTTDSYTAGSYKSPLFHYVILSNLAQATTYYYSCGDSSRNIWSSVYSFKTPSSQPKPVTIGCVGDLGQTAHTKETLEGLASIKPELAILVGDLSYADGDQKLWDSYGVLLQNYSVSIPWMYLPGNHENENTYHFTAYDSRYLMTPGLSQTDDQSSSIIDTNQKTAPSFSFSPSSLSQITDQYSGSGGGNYYYSFDYSWVHFIMLSSETDYSVGSEQYVWLKNDLSSVDRTKTPWIVASWHRPWYSSNSAHQGEGEKMRKSFESLLYQYKVDFCMSGHVHAYERTKRVYNFQLDNKAPYYFTIGDGGNREGLALPWEEPQPTWSAFRLAAYGYSAFHVYNTTHIHWQMFRDSDFSVADQLWIIKN